MLNLDLRFHLLEGLGDFFGLHTRPRADLRRAEVVLEGFVISAEIGGKVYEIVSEPPPHPNRPGAVRWHVVALFPPAART